MNPSTLPAEKPDCIYNMEDESVHPLLSTTVIADVVSTVTKGKLFC